MDDFDRKFNRMKRFIWIFTGIIFALTIAIAILSVALNVYYVRGLFNADIPEWLKWAFLLFC